MIERETMHLAIRSVIQMGETDREAGEIAVKTNRALLVKIQEMEEVPDVEMDPKNVQDSVEALTRFREAVAAGGSDQDLEDLTKNWTLSDYYAVLRLTLAYYGERG